MVFPELALTGYPPEDLLLKTHFLDAAGAALEELAAAHARDRRAGRLPRARRRRLQLRRGAGRRARWPAVYRKIHLPNYGVFDEQRYFQAGERPGDLRAERRDARPHDLRGHLGARAARHLRGARRRRGDREPVRLALPRRQGRRARADARPARPRQPRRGAVLQHRRAARTSWCSTATAWPSTRTGEVLARAPQFEEALTLCTVDPGAVAAARLRDPRHRAAVQRERASGRPAPARLADLDVPAEAERGRRPGGRACWRPRRRSTPRCAPGCATTCARTASSAWCSASPAGSTRRWWRCWRSTRSGAERVTCVIMPSPYSSEGTQRRRPRDRREPRHRAARAVDRGRRWSGYDELLARAVRGPRARPHRGEPPGADPRQPGDGAVEQVRLAGAHHRQQVRAVGGLRHALRRHGGRLRRAQGRVQGLGLPPGALAQRAGGPRAGAGVGARPPAVGRAARAISSTRTRCRPTRCSTRSSPATWSRTSTPPSWRRRGCRAEDVERVIRMVDRAEYKRRQAPPGHPHLHQGLRPRPAPADHQPLRDTRRAPGASLRAL